jgi:predicted transcriptional regulator/DNA-binding XRE family transcriptional regulator
MNAPKLGKQIRAMRRQRNVTQAGMAQQLGISPSYLNLIEHDQRSVSANLLLKLAQQYDVDLRSFASGELAALASDLTEVFSDPVFEDQKVPAEDLRELVASSPDAARATRHLYQLFLAARNSSTALAERMHERQDAVGVDRAELFSEQVSDLIQRHVNYFPGLEEEATRLWKDAHLEYDGLFRGLRQYLQEHHQIRVRVVTVAQMEGAVRRFDPETREVLISEGLNYESRIFQLAHQIALLNCSTVLEEHTADPQLTTEASRRLCRVALANYFAGAVVMPYEDFLSSARKERYDIDLLSHRFRCSFEQVCHRLTTLGRQGAEGVPFSMVRVDIAGNISKKFSAGGLHFPRFSGLCPLRNVHLAFLQPGQVRVQLSRLPDGKTFFSIARTVRKNRGGYHTLNVRYAIGLACDVESAREIVYSDGIDLTQIEAAVPVGVTCRLCPRMDCESRAFPSIQEPLEVDENKRGLSFYAPVKD